MVRDPSVQRLLPLVVFTGAGDDDYRWRFGATVTVTSSRGGSETRRVDFPAGSAVRGLGWAEVDAKFRALTAGVGLSSGVLEQTLDRVHRLEELSGAAALLEPLRAPAGRPR